MAATLALPTRLTRIRTMELREFAALLGDLDSAAPVVAYVRRGILVPHLEAGRDSVTRLADLLVPYCIGDLEQAASPIAWQELLDRFLAGDRVDQRISKAAKLAAKAGRPADYGDPATDLSPQDAWARLSAGRAARERLMETLDAASIVSRQVRDCAVARGLRLSRSDIEYETMAILSLRGFRCRLYSNGMRTLTRRWVYDPLAQKHGVHATVDEVEIRRLAGCCKKRGKVTVHGVLGSIGRDFTNLLCSDNSPYAVPLEPKHLQAKSSDSGVWQSLEGSEESDHG